MMTFLLVGLLALTAFCSYIGDDDVVYNFLDRKPTPREGLIRIRWVFLKIITSMVLGGSLAIFIGAPVLRDFSISFTKNQGVLFILACMGLANIMIAMLQNVIRLLTGRPTRPVIDGVVWRHNLNLWRGKR